MMITTTERVEGRNYQVLGLVQGSTIQCKNIGRDITQGLRQFVGGELPAYTEMMDRARSIAMERMVQQAQQLGADAIVCIRYSTSAVMQGAAEVVAYGTAVKWSE